MASRKGSSAEATAAADFFDPVYEWLNGGASYLLRLNLPGFKKEDFQVHVEPAGRMTIRGQRPADGGAGSVRLHKVFQLPPTSDLDGIAGRIDGSVLTITVPKLPPGEVAPPQDTDEKEEDEVADEPTDQKAKVDREAERRIEAERATLAAGRHRDEDEKQTGRSKKPPAKKVDEGEEAPKAEATATPSEKAAKRENQDGKAKAEHKAKVGREAGLRIQAARESLAEAERVKGRWKERAAGEGFKWADTIGKKKEVIATAVAAFTLGVFVSRKLFSRN